jgi:shikimate dehydrogenase
MTDSTLRAGVMGWPVCHSLSPRLHAFWLRTYGIDGAYDALPVQQEKLAAALRALGNDGLRGVNLTVPHKELACGIVDELDDNARAIGAANLICVGADGRLTGRNTDAYGFAENLKAGGFAARRGRAVVLGAGGAARAVLYALAGRGFSTITVANRTRERSERLARDFTTPHCAIAATEWNDLGAPISGPMAGADLLVNTTSLGMKGQPPLEIDLSSLPGDACVNDIVYAPLETGLLAQARQRGLQTIDGLGMLLHQAAPSFEAFFGRRPEVTPALRAWVLEGVA